MKFFSQKPPEDEKKTSTDPAVAPIADSAKPVDTPPASGSPATETAAPVAPTQKKQGFFSRFKRSSSTDSMNPPADTNVNQSPPQPQQSVATPVQDTSPPAPNEAQSETPPPVSEPVVEAVRKEVAKEPPQTTESETMPPAPEVGEQKVPVVSESIPPVIDEKPDANADSLAASAPTPDQTQTPPAQESVQNKEKQKESFFVRLKRGLGRTSDSFVQGLGNLFLGKKAIDADMLEELESQLLMADVGIEATTAITDSLTQRVSRKELTQPDALRQALKEELLALLQPCEKPLQFTGAAPYVILMVGVNGVGKTTTIGKLARRYMNEGRSVMLAAGDTFRAAAVEQLQVWGERNKVPVIAQHTGADSASVIYDALQAAKARNVDVLIADTAGRLHNKDNLMEELRKVVRVMGKLDDSAPHEVMLVLDAGTGQNALSQAEHFQRAVGVSGLTLTKLDGTAKGGIIFAIARKLGLPIRFIGVGEAAEDLRPFAAREFVDALFGEEKTG